MNSLVRATWALLAGVMVLLLVFLAYYALPFRSETYAWNQRIEAEVLTPQGPVTATVVQGTRVKYYPNGLFATGTDTEWTFTGEALLVDLGEALGPRRYLFGLYAGTAYAAQDPGEKGLTRRELLQRNAALADGEPLEIRLALWVGFADVNDPDSVFHVDAANLAARYGEGYRMIRQSRQITADPVTKGPIRAALPWLRSLDHEIKLALPDGRIQTLHKSMFDTEISK